MYKHFLSFCFILLFSCAFIALPLSAQSSGFSVRFTLVDASNDDVVPFATTSLTKKGSEKALTYALTDADGKVTLRAPRGEYILKAEIMGYKTLSQEIKIEKSINLGHLKMEVDAEQLSAASVSAVGNPIIVKKDTIEYNASSFKTSDNDMLEQLLKKLPGVEVAEDGSITANGETIKKITIDGKTFFLDDPQLATKNIPAKIIEKVKVVEKKSDQAMFTGIDDGEEETVIDLSIRPGMMQGWFGNVMLGGGHDVPGKNSDMNDWRYQGAAMIGRFTDKSQISIILNGNNTNNRGFNDMSGSMMQGMRGGRGMGRGRGGWGSGNGITTSWMGGLNGAFTLCEGDMDLSGNYLYNGSIKDVEEISSKTTYLEDNRSLLYNNTGLNHTMTQGHRFGIRLDHKFSENTSILFQPQFNFGEGNFIEHSDYETFNAGLTDTTKTNKGFSDNTGYNKNWTASGYLLFRQKLGKPGRTLSLNVRYNFSENSLDGLNQSATWVTTDGSSGKPDIVNQHILQSSTTSSLSGRLVYTEPIGKWFFLEANYGYAWNRSKSQKNAFDSAINAFASDSTALLFNPEGAIYNNQYSNNISNTYQNHRAGLNFSYQREKFRAQLGASINPTVTDNVTNGKTYNSTVINWSPQAMLNYEINDNTNLRMFYFGRSSQPSTSQLMPVPDNTDPLNVALGNPYLEPYFSHNIRGMFGYTNKKTFTSVHARFGGSVVESPIVNAQWYTPSGTQFAIPVNGPASGSVNARVMINSPLGKSNFSIFSMTYANYSGSTSYLGKSSLNTDKYYDSANADFKYDLFHSDFPDRESLERVFTANKIQSLSFVQRLRFTFRSDLVEVNLGGRTRMNKSWYTMETANQNLTWNNQLDASMNWTIPGGINFIADVDYNWYNGYTTNQPSEVILNAEISKLLFKKKFTLSLKAYDILGQSKNLSVTDAVNYHQEVRNNTLGRYIILSLTYRFGDFNKSQPGGHGRGHGRGGYRH